MTLASVNPGDIVQVGDHYAHVRARERGRLLVRWLKTTNERWVKAREVDAHWRQSRRVPVGRDAG